MKTAAAYIRVSDARQDEFSPDSQLKLIKEYCNKNGIALPEELIFYDDGISAKSAKRRPQFNEMIALAKQKEKPFDLILVWKFSRFARNQEESIVYKSLLRKNGVDVISISEPIGDNPFGGLIERIIEWMDEFYLIRLSDEVRRGMTERAARGKPNTAPPFGYRMSEGKYVIHEEEAQIVREIFSMFLSGMGFRAISNNLQRRGIKNKNQNPIDNRGVEYILNNPCYNGKLRWNPSGRSASKRVFNNPDDILTDADHEKLIDDETFEKTKKHLAERKRANRKYVRESTEARAFALRGLVKCSACGATLVLQHTKKGVQCNRYAHGSCETSHYISLNKLNAMVISELKKSTEKLAFNISGHSLKALIPNVDYDKLISKEKLKLQRARDAYQSGVDSLEEYRYSKKAAEKEISRLVEEKEQKLTESNSFNRTDYSKTVTEVISLLESPDISESAKNQALKSIISHITFNKPDNTVTLNFYL